MSNRINPKIFDRIKSNPKIKNKISERAIKNEISRIRRNNPGVSLDAAACEFAKMRGVNLMRYLSDPDRVSLQYMKRASGEEQKQEKEIKPRTIRLKPSVPTNVPFLIADDISNAGKMSETYVILYCFENSLRKFIMKEMEKKYGSKWWEDKIPEKIQKEAEVNKNQEKDKRWHATRGAHPIFYITMDNLKKIVSNQWPLFKKSIKEEQTWIMSRLNEIKDSRNIIAHHNPLPKKEIDRIKLYFDDWKSQMN